MYSLLIRDFKIQIEPKLQLVLIEGLIICTNI